MSEQLLSTGDVARRLGVSAEFVRALERRGKITSVRTVGGRRIFAAGDVERLAVEREQQRQAKAARAGNST